MYRFRQAAGVVLVAWMLALALAPQAAASSAGVAALQVALKSLGLYPAAVDGVRGPLTAGGVRRFQRGRRLLVDGIAGPQTRRALGPRGRPRLGSRLIQQGNSGWDVAALQFLLIRRGHQPGGVDGAVGAATGSAVMAFQRAAGLGVDGIVGGATIAALRRPTVPRTVPAADVRFYHPVPGAIGDRFGAPRNGGRSHSGIDFPVGAGTMVQAAGVGTTVFAGWNSGGYGNLVVVQHRLGYTTWYAHLSSVTSWVGEQVSGGTRIGYVGSTGHSTGPHLHFEVRLWNNPIDPLPYMLGGPVTAARAPARVRCVDPAAYKRAPIDACRPGGR
jgi:peptidoglycan hydrolase-like protein with peptidoglycan-binding domain